MASVAPIQLSSKQQPPVLIIGAHRSGTTATARALEILGLQIGQDLDSHRESKKLQQLHEHYLRQCGASWYDPAPFLEKMETSEGVAGCAGHLRENFEQRFGEIFAYRNNVKGLWWRGRLRRGAAWGWKEPRTTLFAPAWLKLFPDANVIHIVRDVRLVAESIRRRELEFRAAGDAPLPHLDDLDYCANLARIYVERGRAAKSLTNRFREVRFEEIQENPEDALSWLAEFCGLSFDRATLRKSARTIKPRRA